MIRSCFLGGKSWGGTWNRFLGIHWLGVVRRPWARALFKLAGCTVAESVVLACRDTVVDKL
jgi:hypothetical protein